MPYKSLMNATPVSNLVVFDGEKLTSSFTFQILQNTITITVVLKVILFITPTLKIQLLLFSK